MARTIAKAMAVSRRLPLGCQRPSLYLPPPSPKEGRRAYARISRQLSPAPPTQTLPPKLPAPPATPPTYPSINHHYIELTTPRPGEEGRDRQIRPQGGPHRTRPASGEGPSDLPSTQITPSSHRDAPEKHSFGKDPPRRNNHDQSVK